MNVQELWTELLAGVPDSTPVMGRLADGGTLSIVRVDVEQHEDGSHAVWLDLREDA